MAHAPVQTNIAASLVAIWKEYLGLESIGIHDDFFELGGDSLLAIQVITKIQTTFGVALEVHALLEYSTVAKLEAIILQRLSATSKDETKNFPPSVVKLKEGGSERPLFLIHPIGGQVFCYKPLVECMKYDGPLYGIQADYQERQHLSSIEDIASHYLDAIRQVQPEGAYQLLGF